MIFIILANYMYRYIYVCIYIYIYIYACIHIHICIYVCVFNFSIFFKYQNFIYNHYLHLQNRDMFDNKFSHMYLIISFIAYT